MSDLLKSYARKRQVEAEPPFQMPPATRAVLREEVTRVFHEKVAGRATEVDPLPFFWRRLLWGGAITAVLFVAAGLWMRLEQSGDRIASGQSQSNLLFFAQNSPESRPQVADKEGLPERVREFELGTPGTANGGLPVGTVASATQQTTTLNLALRDHASDRLELAMSGSSEVEAVSNAPRYQFGLPGSPTEKDGTRMLTDAVPERSKVFLLTKRQAQTPLLREERAAGASVAPQAPAAPAPIVARAPRPDQQSAVYADAAMNQTRPLRFQQVDPQNRYRRNLNSPPPLKVLTRFEVQTLGGQQVRILDADGSVYAGDFQPVPGQQAVAQAVNTSLTAGAAGTLMQVKPQSNAAQGLARLSSSKAVEEQPFYFRAVGTNVTLNELVVFTGEFDPSAASAANATVAGGFGGVQNTVATTQVEQLRTAAPVSNVQNLTQTVEPAQVNSNQLGARILGRASVGGKNQLRIEAQQVAP
jgi:hypothetical protein